MGAASGDARLGIVTGLAAERDCLKAVVKRNRLLVVCAGPGPKAAKAAACRLADLGVVGLVSFGTAGALTTDLKSGDLVIADTVHGSDGRQSMGDSAWRARLIARLHDAPAPASRIASVSEPVLDPAAKASLLQSTGAVAVDLESHAVAEVAWTAGLPFLGVRSIVDGRDHVVPRWTLAVMAGDGTLNRSLLTRHLIRRPGDVVPLCRLGIAFGSARARLRRVAGDAGTLFQLLG